ncbi:hypothetical protein YB2330_004726 [Saitoella coloradoensis]
MPAKSYNPVRHTMGAFPPPVVVINEPVPRFSFQFKRFSHTNLQLKIPSAATVTPLPTTQVTGATAQVTSVNATAAPQHKHLDRKLSKKDRKAAAKNYELANLVSAFIAKPTSAQKVTTAQYKERKKALKGLQSPDDAVGIIRLLAGMPEPAGGVEEKQLKEMGYTIGRPLKVETERISGFVYWWGFEIAVPRSQMPRLAQAKNSTEAILNLLSAVAPMEFSAIRPMSRIIVAYINSEYATAANQDRGQGIVLAATWLLPLVVVPRPWDL